MIFFTESVNIILIIISNKPSWVYIYSIFGFFNMKNTLSVQSNPNGVVVGNVGDTFFRDDADFYFTSATTDSTSRLSIPVSSFLGKYNTPLYKGWPIVFATPSETWVKSFGRNNKIGWTFFSSTSPISPPAVVHIPPTPPVPSFYSNIKFVSSASMGSNIIIMGGSSTDYLAVKAPDGSITIGTAGYCVINATEDGDKEYMVYSCEHGDSTPTGSITLFNISDAFVSSVLFTGSFPYLTSVTIQNNNLTSLDLSGETELQQIALYNNNNLSSLIIGNSQVTNLDISATNITNLDASLLLNLNSVNAGGPTITEFTLTGSTNLNSLQLSGCNNLSTLNLSELNAIQILYLDFNPSLQLPNLSSFNTLTQLSLTQCQMSSFNPSYIPSSVQTLYMSSNQFSTIDLTGIDQLLTLDISQNPITLMDNIITDSTQKSTITNLTTLNCPILTQSLVEYTGLQDINIGGSLEKVEIGTRNSMHGVSIQGGSMTSMDLSSINTITGLLLLTLDNLTSIILPPVKVNSLSLTCMSLLSVTIPSGGNYIDLTFNATPVGFTLDLSQATRLDGIRFYYNSHLASITFPSSPTSVPFSSIYFDQSDAPQDVIDLILATAVAQQNSSGRAYLRVSSGATPSSLGYTNATALRSRGWVVLTN